MASTSNAHLNLSDFIKKVHENLRIESEIVGSEKAWENHCNDEITLSKYALAMKELATSYWDKNLSKDNSRVIWAYNLCLEYFRTNIQYIRKKENLICTKLGLEIPREFDLPTDKWKLLDVGSCYNPFREYSCFDITPIDIAPSSSEVFKCDFLKLVIADGTVINENDNSIVKLERRCFDVIVFCLLLEYLPNPQQRSICCQKAYELLKTEGILIIISPDSNHVGSNAKLMKSWRFVLAQMGFSRIKYEKLAHVHCMAFRKSFHKEIPKRWAELYKTSNLYEEIFIPQDFKSKIRNTSVHVGLSESDVLSFSGELPFHDEFS